MNDNMFSLKDQNGKEYRAEVIDIFSVDEYPDNDYLLYSFGNTVGNDVQVNISKAIVNSTGGIDLVGIEDDKEWAAVNKAVDSMIENLGGG